MKFNQKKHLIDTNFYLLTALHHLNDAYQDALQEIAFLKKKLRDQENKIRF